MQAEELFEKLETHLALKWSYGNDRPAAEVATEHQKIVKGEGTIPPAMELDILYELAELGNFHELNKRIALIEESAPHSLPFVQKVRALAENFQGDEICEFIEHLRADELE